MVNDEIGKHYWLLKRKSRIAEEVEENLVIRYFRLLNRKSVLY